MKTIIISDIKSNFKSVIPYGLNLAKALEAETEVLHIVDPRVIQGEYSALSDSKSITPGRKLSYEEIKEREKKEAGKELDELLSREVSRLNYPLKINTVIEEGELEKAVEKRAEEKIPHLFIISAEPDKTIFYSKQEIIDVVKNAHVRAIIIPPGTKFQDYKKILLPVDFNSDNIDEFKEVKFLMERFNPLVNVVDVTKSSNFLSMELKSKIWKKHTKKLFLPEKIKTNILKGDDFAETLINYTNRNKYSLLILFQKKRNVVKRVMKNDALNKILKNSTIPVFLYCWK
jgi:nucleotide-binding universal stress UspA family protein